MAAANKVGSKRGEEAAGEAASIAGRYRLETKVGADASIAGRYRLETKAGADASIAGRYRLGAKIGAGASAEVFLADDLAAGDRCAVKLFMPGDDSARLVGEFARLTELSHPGIVRVRDLGEVRDGDFQGRRYLVTDHVPGPSILSLAEIASDEERLHRFITAADVLADALSYLHGRGIVHGDVSPANVRLDEGGRPVLLDFGLAERVWAQPRVAGGAFGTPGYLAPEALIGQRVPLGDLFSLGATLYAAWTGAPPFGNGIEALRRMHEGPPPAPSALHPGLPGD